MLADAESQPLGDENASVQLRKALSLIAGMETIRPLTPAYHHLRAGYLERLGEHAAAREQDALAARTSASASSIDEFLAGEQAYRQGDLPAAIAALQRALSLEPDHFWALYLLAVCHLKRTTPVKHRPHWWPARAAGQSSSGLTCCAALPRAKCTSSSLLKPISITLWSWA